MGQLQGTHLAVEEVEELPVGEDEEGIACLGVYHWETMDLVLHQHLHCFVQAEGGEGRSKINLNQGYEALNLTWCAQ